MKQYNPCIVLPDTFQLLASPGSRLQAPVVSATATLGLASPRLACHKIDACLSQTRHRNSSSSAPPLYLLAEAGLHVESWNVEAPQQSPKPGRQSVSGATALSLSMLHSAGMSVEFDTRPLL